MTDWKPFREPLRVTLSRTLSIAIVAGGIVAMSTGGVKRWPLITLLMLWPAVGGHWVDILFLSVIRPRLPRDRSVQGLARIAVWFAGGVLLAAGVRLTLRLLSQTPAIRGLTWTLAGAIFVAIELVAHGALHLRRRPSFYDGMG